MKQAAINLIPTPARESREQRSEIRFISSTLFALVLLASAALSAQTRATLRVGFWTLWHDKSVTLTAAGAKAQFAACEACDAESFKTPITLTADGDEVVYSAEGRPTRHTPVVEISGPVTIAAHKESETPRLPMRITAHKGVLVMAATIPVERYVERVVASESSSADTDESLKALAVVVRSFALHMRHGHAEYDLCDSTHCQLLHWHGNPSRAAAAHAAAMETAGETLWFHGAKADAYFNQNCGGRSAKPSEIWPAAVSKAYLSSHADKYCSAGGARSWAASLTKDEISAALSNAGLVAPGWRHLTVGRVGSAERGESPRVLTMRVVANNDGKEFSAEDFRLAIGRAYGWGKILSTWFEVHEENGNYHFSGRGSGHGVGLCQAGAAEMATEGLSAERILAEYFPGAEARDEESGRAWQRKQAGGLTIETLSEDDAAHVSEVKAAYGESESRAGGLLVNSDQLRITLRAYPSPTAFRDATLAPGWVAAFTEGNFIASQPLAILSARKQLRKTLRHEFLHAIVESVAARSTPLWLHEGLVELLSRDEAGADLGIAAEPTMTLDDLNLLLKTAATERESATAHREAAAYAARLIERYGRKQVESWVRNGLPESAMKEIGRR